MIAVLLAVILTQPPAPAVVKLQPTEADAVAWAFTALASYPDAVRPTIRFVWLPPWATLEWHGATDFAVNASASQARTLHRGMPHAGGYLLAYDLARLANGKQLARLIELWDGCDRTTTGRSRAATARRDHAIGFTAGEILWGLPRPATCVTSRKSVP